MSNYLANHPLFSKIEKEALEHLLSCFCVYKKEFKKNEYIVLAGRQIDFVGVILTGQVFMENIDYFGNSYIYTEIRQDNLFGEVFLGPSAQNCTVNYKAATDCVILFLKTEHIFHICRYNCRSHQQLIENLVNLLALKSRSLLDKIEIISSKSIRERILTYLLKLSKTQQSITVTSPLNHKEMACFLCVNRSSMLRELHQMKEEKLIDYNKNLYFLKYIMKSGPEDNEQNPGNFF